MSNWEIVKINDIGKVVTGKTPRTDDSQNYGTDFMFIGPTDLHKHFIITESEKMISSKGLASIKGSILDGLSILVGCIGWDMGNVALVNCKCATNQQINSITEIKESYNPLYIYYWLKHKKNYLFQIANVTRTPILNKSDFSNIELSVPNKIEQDKIAKFLSDLDAKIETNNRINTELEAMAKTLYDYWFVQFDFPYSPPSEGCPQDGVGIGKPYKTSGGKMVWNEELKREIPEGWEVGTLDSIGDIIGGSTPSKAIDENFCIGEGTPWITPKDLSNNKGKKFITRGEYDVTERGLKEASLKIMPEGTVLLSSRAPIGYLAIARTDVTTNQGFKSFVPKKDFSSEYVYHTIQNHIPEIEANSSGSTFKEVSSSTLKTIKTILPANSVLSTFYDLINPIFKKQDCIELENQELASLRDWLLPMLMNGQVGVGDVEEQLGMVAEASARYGK